MVEHIGDLRNIQRTARAHHAQKIQIYFQLRIVGLGHELVDKTVGHNGNVGAAVLIDFQTAHNLTCFRYVKFTHILSKCIISYAFGKRNRHFAEKPRSFGPSGKMWILWKLWIRLQKLRKTGIKISTSFIHIKNVDIVDNYCPRRSSPMFTTFPAPIVINRSPGMQFSSINFSISSKEGK